MRGDRKSVVICMGSSCFSRGNKRNIEVIQQYLAANPMPEPVDFKGHLCEGQCSLGPNITLNGVMHHGLDPVVLSGLLQEQLKT